MPDHDPRKREILNAYLPRGDIEDEADLWSRAVPIVLHGDGVPVGSMSLDAVSWGGFLGGQLSTLASKNMISGLLNRTVSEETKAIYWGAVFLSLLCLCAGKFLSRDLDGNPLQGLNFFFDIHIIIYNLYF